MWRAVILAVCGCGRFNFDAQQGAGGDGATGDAKVSDVRQDAEQLLFTGLLSRLPLDETGGTNGRFDQPQITIAFWVKQTKLDTTGNGVSQLSKRVDIAAVARNSWQLEDFPNMSLAFTSNHGQNNNVQLFAASAIQIGVWQHLAISYDGAAKRIYVDGVQRAMTAQAVPIAYDSHAMQIGCDDNSGLVEHFPGALDEIQVYGRALTAQEVAQLAAW